MEDDNLSGFGKKEEVRVRVAPSPTGRLHVGTARTALFNWLFARQRGGKFLIRIEDTDKIRSEGRYEKDILEGLEWLDLKPDEKIERQSERGEIYKKYINKLLEEKKAYYCYCTKEELQAEKDVMLAQGLAPKYSGKCRKKPENGREPQLIRLAVAETKNIGFKDIIRGKINFESDLIGDIPIARANMEPLYNFAVVVDDCEMRISHVIRGEDHISNTPKQILIYWALGWHLPEYAHIPLILSAKGGKMSKRDEETKSLLGYKDDGYLPEAMINFLALLGWHPKKDREVLSREEILKEFKIEDIQKGGAVFQLDKLNWLNGHYIKEMSNEKFIESAKRFALPEWLKKEDVFNRGAFLQKERIKILVDIRAELEIFFELPEYEPELLVWKNSTKEEVLEILKQCELYFKGGITEAEKKIEELANEKGKGNVFWPLRVALSGQKNSPPPIEIAKVIGEEDVLERIGEAIRKLA